MICLFGMLICRFSHCSVEVRRGPGRISSHASRRMSVARATLVLARVSRPPVYPSIWSRMRTGEFPRSLVVGKGRAARVKWRYSEILDWMDRLPRSSLLGDPDRDKVLAREASERGRKGGQTTQQLKKRRRLAR